jgi:hypothetical protein
LIAVAGAAQVFAPGGFLGEADQRFRRAYLDGMVRRGVADKRYVVVMSEFAALQTGEVGFRTALVQAPSMLSPS